MSRNNKQRRHEKQQKQQKRRRREAMIRGTAAPRWIAVCEQAVTLLKCRSWDEAREVLEQYEWEHPGQREVLRLLLDVYHEQGDYVPYCRTCRRLLEKEPDNLNLHLMLAGGYWNDARLASALRAFRRFVELWPDDPLADGAREGIEQLEPAVEELLHGLPFAGEERLELAAMHEEVMASLAAGDCERTIRIGEQLLARSPDFAPTMNNLSEAYFRLGHADKAIDISRRVLQQHPDDFHALSNLTRYQFLSGRQDEARELAEQLRSVRSERDDLWYKQCEALSFLGDDDAVLACFAEAERAGVTRQQTPAEALLYHLAAVALARQGQQRQATRYWRQALKIQPGLKLAKENLADAAQRIGQRHGPWCFSLSSWIREELIDNLCASLDRQARRKSDETGERAVRHFAEAHPEVVSLVPALLDRGDPAGREFAWRIAALLDTPEALDALRGFCLSQRGPDTLRVETANRLCRAGVLPSGAARLWLDGRWQQVEVIGFEITDEPVGDVHGMQVNDWSYEGCQALRRGDGAAAASLFQKSIDFEGESPDLLNNLALAYLQQGRTGEALQLARQIHERWPDYFFGRIAMANMATAAGDYESADSYLAPLRQRRKLHTTEFTSLASANVRLLLASRNVSAARTWLAMWRQIDPEHPELERLELKCSSPGAFRALKRLLPTRRR